MVQEVEYLYSGMPLNPSPRIPQIGDVGISCDVKPEAKGLDHHGH
jgi:hypothetical protein